MLTREKVERVRELLATEMSQREISRITGVSRDAVRRIFKGRWQEMPSPQPMPHSTQLRGRRIGRCPECGARVLMPCIACRVLPVVAAEGTVLSKLAERTSRT